MHSDQCAVGIREESNTTDKRRNLFSNAERKKKKCGVGVDGVGSACLYAPDQQTFPINKS